jgi:hypothetical protein
MKIRTLITALAIAGGSSSAALADSAVTFRANATWSYGTPAPAPVIVRDHRAPVDDDCNESPVVAARWTTNGYRPVYQTEPAIWNPNNKVIRDRFGTAKSTQYAGPVFSLDGRRAYGMVPLTQPTRIENTQTDREDFILMGSAGHVRTLQLKGVRGSTFVTKVTIEFMNEQAQVVNVSRSLSAGAAINIGIEGSGRGIKRIFVYGQSGPGAMYQLLGA